MRTTVEEKAEKLHISRPFILPFDVRIFHKESAARLAREELRG